MRNWDAIVDFVVWCAVFGAFCGVTVATGLMPADALDRVVPTGLLTYIAINVRAARLEAESR